MSPVSSPEGVETTAIAPATLQRTVDMVTEQAVAGVRAWQGTVEARLARMERTLTEMTSQTRALSPAAAAQALQSATATQPLPVMTPAAAFSVSPVGPPPMAAPVQAVAPAAYPVAQAAPAYSVVPAPMPAAYAVAPAGTSSAYPSIRQSVASFAIDPHDPDMMALSGGRRKRRIAILALALLLLGVGGLVAMAIVSQATHGL